MDLVQPGDGFAKLLHDPGITRGLLLIDPINLKTDIYQVYIFMILVLIFVGY